MAFAVSAIGDALVRSVIGCMGQSFKLLQEKDLAMLCACNNRGRIVESITSLHNQPFPASAGIQ